MLISSDREIYHSPLIRIQNRRRVFCAGFVCLEAMQAWHGFLLRYLGIAPCFALPQSRTHSHIVVLRPTFMLMCVRGTNPVSHAHASMARLQDCAPGII